MACNDCPELNPNPNEGCLQPINSSCATYDGNDVDCADIASGQTISQVIETLANNDCELQEQLDDLEDDLQELSGVVLTIEDKIQELSGNQYEFSCEELSECELNSLGNVDTNPVSGDSIIFNGEKWINYTPEQLEPYEFSCTELAACSINSLGDINISSPNLGQALIYNGTEWVNQILPSNTYTGDSGITQISNNFRLGGTLLQDTSINGNNNTYEIGITNAKNFFVKGGASPGSAGSSKSFFSFDLPTNYNSPDGYSANLYTTKHNINAYPLTDGKSIISNNISSEYNITANTTIGSGSIFSGTSYSSKFNTTSNNINLTKTQGSAGYTLLRHLYNHVTILQLDSGSTNINEFITFNKFVNHGILTNYNNAFQSNEFTEFVQFYIGNAKGDASTTTSLKMPNTYGIWQEGADDKNFFRGDIINSSLAGVGNRAVYSTANGTLTNSSSDETLKDDVTGLSYGLDTIMGLRPVSYNWIDKAKYGTQREIGFIAQEIIQYVPEVVGENASGTLSVDYPKLTAVLTNAIQELKNKVDLLQTQVTNLQNPPEQS